MKYAALILIILASSQNIMATDETKTFYFTAPQDSEAQPAPAIPEPAFAAPSKVDALAVQVDELNQKIKELEKKLEACSCFK